MTQKKVPSPQPDIRAACAALGGRIAITAQVNSAVSFDGPIDIGEGAVIYAPVKIGAFTYVNVNTVVYAHVTLGRFCSIGRGAQLGLARHPTDYLSSHPFQFSPGLFARVPGYLALQTTKWRFHEPTKIGHDVWIGANAMVVSGVTVGTGAVIGAGAVVTKDVAPYDIVGGVPARKIRQRFEAPIIDRLLASRWWELPLDVLATLEFTNIESVLSKIEGMRTKAQ